MTTFLIEYQQIKLKDMTREEEIIKAARVYANGIAQHLPNKKYCEEDFSTGAQWADRSMIAKACEWMDCYIDNYLFVDMEDAPGIRWDDFIDDFRKAMKGE